MCVCFCFCIRGTHERPLPIGSAVPFRSERQRSSLKKKPEVSYKIFALWTAGMNVWLVYNLYQLFEGSTCRVDKTNNNRIHLVSIKCLGIGIAPTHYKAASELFQLEYISKSNCDQFAPGKIKSRTIRTGVAKGSTE